MKFFHDLFNIDDKTEGVSGLTDELIVSYLYDKTKNQEQNNLLVCNTLFEANKLFKMLKNYTDDVLLFPMDDFLTSEALAISPELKLTRLETLKNLTQTKNKIVVTNLMGYLRFLPRPDLFLKKSIKIKNNDEIKIDDLVRILFQIGYSKEVIVNKTGELAVRGFVVDIFPVFMANPIRIEFWGDTVDSIRLFDVNSQLTIKNLDEIDVYPNTEFITEKEIDNFALKQRDLINYEKVYSLNDYVDRTYFYHFDEIKVGFTNLEEEIVEYKKSEEIDSKVKFMHDLDKIVPAKAFYFLNFDTKLKGINKVEVYDSKQIDYFPRGKEEILKHLKKIKESKKTIIICVSNRYRINKILDEFESNDFVFTTLDEIYKNKCNLVIKQLSEGFIIDDYYVISEKEIFHQEERTVNYKNSLKFGTKIKDITKLNIGDYVVHNINGIGRYLGIKTLTKNNFQKDYLVVEYRGGDKLYIPVEKIDYISKYSSSDGSAPKISKLGSVEWQKTKLKVQKKIENIAGELIELYAKREAMKGFAFPADDELQLRFEKEFPYDETLDQIKVTEEIKKDMQSNHPMDRLLCGDVGYGKTEVAFRAIFKAVLAGKQVALLCPTTILSQQHYYNAKERFKNFPVNIRLLNRFVTKKEITETLLDLQAGKVDILIGTHRILSDDVKFNDLGLLVIDEEQRFGVKHKEKLKKLKTNVDVLTLTATPIPRTLQMSMTGIRSLSIIETPPAYRYPVQTYVLAENSQIIKDAIYKELSRDGQVFILYNYVNDINLKAAEIKKLVPEAKIAVAHGQMDKNELEEIMLKFINYEYDVLVCTTIIETGIDIPRVNTLLVMDADRFGLAQLYQLRGRVGRSDKIAYCYLMYNRHKILSEVAVKRLKVIKEFTELGSGFAIAMRDLSIRGAGDLLGSEQAGFVASVGMELFLKMLEDEIKKLKGEAIIEDEVEDVKPLLDVTTAISDNYVKDENLKIEIHKLINEIDSQEKLVEIKNQIEDRFGKINDDLLIYMHEEWFEKIAGTIGIKKVKQTKNFVQLILPSSLTKKINGEMLFLEANKISRAFRFSMQFGELVITLDTVTLDKHFIYYLIPLLEVIKKATLE